MNNRFLQYKLRINIHSIERNDNDKGIKVHVSIHQDQGAGNDDASIRFAQLISELGDRKIEIESDEIQGNSVLVIIYSIEEFVIAQDKKASDRVPFNQTELRDEPLRNEKLPIIHLATMNRFWDFMCGDSIDSKLPSYIPRYFQIMDNSIWNYLIPVLKDNKEKKSFCNLFCRAIAAIYDNYENNIYKLPVAKEYADLNARISQQSYLSGSHAVMVSPFIFHSETAIERLIENDKGCRKLKNGYGKNENGVDKCQWRWRFLLVDDRAVEKDANDVPNSNCKMSIIKRLIERALFNERQDKSICVKYREYNNEEFTGNDSLSDAIIVIDCVSSLDDAVKVLKSYKYDIILLDYLLDGGSNRNYGYELLEKIDYIETIFEQFNDCRLEVIDKEKTILNQLKTSTHKDDYQDLIAFIENSKNDVINEKDINKIKSRLEQERFKVGPRGRMFFIFISAYTTAVNERLLAQGLNRSESYWHIDTGACPTNTPQLFTYNLLQLMDKRLYDSGILDLSITEILKLTKDIFIPREMVADKSSVRERASEHYQDVLSLQYYYRKMLKDVEIPQGYKQGDHLFNINGSVLISHFMLENQHLDGLLEHLTELVHLTAFGTIRQWAEMWEEYLYIRAKLEEIDDGRQDFKAVCDYIEEYILNLKAQQR